MNRFLSSNSFKTSKWLAIIIILTGIILRVIFYLGDRSLWHDEAKLALVINNLSFYELSHPGASTELKFQPYPLGFLILEKSLVNFLGDQELIFRLFPLISGVFSLILFNILIKCYLSSEISLIGLGLLTFSPQLIYYSSEVRPYSSDILISLILLLMIEFILGNDLNKRAITILGVVGAVCIWFSTPSVFVWTGGYMALIMIFAWERNLKKVAQIFQICLLWAIGFLIYYFCYLRYFLRSTIAVTVWPWDVEGGYFAVFPITSLKIVSCINQFILEFRMALYLLPTYQAISTVSLFAIGTISFILLNGKRFLILYSPVIMTLIAAGLKKYPFHQRLIFFLIPIFIIIITCGAEQIIKRTRNIRPLVFMCIISLLFFFPLRIMKYSITGTNSHEEIKHVLAKIKELKQPGEVIYVYYGANAAFQYYAQRFGFKEEECIFGIGAREDTHRYNEDIQKLNQYKKVWLIFSHIHENEDEIILGYMDKIAKRECRVKNPHVAAYLYKVD